ncbi:hypothetical protein GALL_387900 [mine drainage metagenome]|uniref:Uncharacterized protein n=1 Tax=mine drainage metagenome TaxID=410659 RepID=A0A1J5QPN6_9ZZZZ
MVLAESVGPQAARRGEESAADVVDRVLEGVGRVAARTRDRGPLRTVEVTRPQVHHELRRADACGEPRRPLRVHLGGPQASRRECGRLGEPSGLGQTEHGRCRQVEHVRGAVTGGPEPGQRRLEALGEPSGGAETGESAHLERRPQLGVGVVVHPLEKVVDELERAVGVVAVVLVEVGGLRGELDLAEPVVGAGVVRGEKL